MGDAVRFTGESKTFSVTGNKLVDGGQGEVTGPTFAESYQGKGVCVLFPGNKGSVSCLLTEVRRLRAASAATPRLRPTHATLPTRPLRYVPRRPLPLCRGAPALTACAAGLN